MDSEIAAQAFYTKRLSVTGVDDETLEQIHKFPFPVQKAIIDELFAVQKKGKPAPELTSASCHCLFHHRYLLPCKHIFHEHIYGVNKLLTADTWRAFQQLFAENGFEIYEHRERVEIAEPRQVGNERDAERRRLAVNELMERVRNRFWQIEEQGNVERTVDFINRLDNILNPILDL